MEAPRSTGTTPFHLLLTSNPLSITLSEISDRSGSPVSYERLSLLQYKRAVIRRLHYALERAEHKQTALQKRYKEYSDKKVYFRIKVQAGDHDYIDRLPRGVRYPESGATDSLMSYSGSLEETSTEGIHKLLPRTTNLYTV